MPVTLTDRVVQQAKASGGRIEIADAVLPGLYLIVQPTGVKSWAVRYRVGRRTRKLTLPGRYPVLTLAKAREAARTALQSVTVGKDPAAAKQAGTPADDTLAAYIALDREKHVSTVRPGTAANINRELEHMQDAWPGRSLRSISKKGCCRGHRQGHETRAVRWCDGLESCKGFLCVVRGTRGRLREFGPIDSQTGKREVPDRVLDDAELKLTWQAADTEGSRRRRVRQAVDLSVLAATKLLSWLEVKSKYKQLNCRVSARRMGGRIRFRSLR